MTYRAVALVEGTGRCHMLSERPMPQLPLASALLHSLPWLSTRGRAAINFLVCENGRTNSAAELASRLGLRNRYQLARLLRSEGLPTYEVLTGWISSLYWRVEAERSATTLHALAQRAHVAPATSYRIVRRVTGSHWSAFRRATADEALRRFVEHCERPRNGAVHQPPAVPARPPRPQGTSDEPVESRGASRVGGTVRLPLSGAPFSVALYGGEAYVTRPHAAAIERIDVRTRRLLGSIPVGCAPTSIAVDAVHQRAYATLQYEDTIAVIDCVTHRVIGKLSVPGDPFPVLLGRAPTAGEGEGHGNGFGGGSGGGGQLFTTTNEDRLFVLNLPSGRVSARLALPATSHFLAMHPAGHRVYVATRAGGTVLEVDAAQLSVSRVFGLGGEPLDLVVSRDGRFLYVVNGRQGLNVVRLTDGRLLRTLKLEGRPVHLAVSPDEERFYVTLVEGGAVAVVDRVSLAVRKLVTGGRPRGLAISGDGRTLIVANEAGWVDVIPV